MKDYLSEDVRNLVVLGHNGSGKSSVIQAMLYEAKQLPRIVSAQSGQSILDFEPLEIKRGQTLSLKLVPIEWGDRKINCIDTPGYVDFSFEAVAGFSVGDNVLIVVDAKEGIDLGTKTAFRWISQEQKPTLFFVNKMDDENVSFHQTYATLRETFGNTVIAFEIPIRESGRVIGSINLLSKKVWYYDKPDHPHPIPEAYQEQVEIHWQEICEAVAMTEDALMERYFEKGDLSESEIVHGVSLGVRSGEIRPVYCGSAAEGVGMRRLLDLITEYLPAYQEKESIQAEDRNGNPVVLKTHESETLGVQVFKTVVDPFVGRISYLKVLSGVLSADSEVLNVNRDKVERISALYSVSGKNQLGIGKLFTGDIGAVLKLQYTKTFDTLAYPGRPVRFAIPSIPHALLGVAIWPETKKDEDKLSNALAKILEEDISARVHNNEETHELILYGMGDQHLDVLVRRLQEKYGVALRTTTPKIVYRETIRKRVVGEGRHKKQTGGAGQFGHVFVEFEPCESDDVIFETRVVGGAVPKQYFPAVEQGLREAMQEGVLSGYKVVGVKATLIDGKYHDVDSKEIAFKQAARLAYLDAMPQGNPQLLEPIVELDIETPEVYTGTIMGDLNKRRGLVLNIETLDHQRQRIKVEVPQAEVGKYLPELRAITQGSASYSQQFLRYDGVPESLVNTVLQQR